ncbi:MAG TPA: ABC transporter ATP-binding protein [Candidatus Dormibacteraeota bacterium]|nr:ABC transporter ATP-binding protein [Candidatus Dormibacteraeota bacterium]
MTVAIALEEVSKRYRVPLDRSTTLKYRMVHPRSSARYRDLFALDGVSMEIPYGEFVGVIGANGCGKSTLLKILAGILRPTTGRVTVNGHVSPFLELGVGFNPELTAKENIYLNGAVLGLTRRQLEGRIGDIIGFAELDDFADQKLKNFSSGMQVRLAFAVAIQADAGILLMDEVLAVGDARFQERCFDVFNRYKRQGRTVVLVTHDLGAVDLYCDTAYLLDHGRLVASGPSGEVCSVYRHMVGQQSDADAAAAAAAVSETLATPTTDEAPVPELGLRRWGTGEVRVTEVEFLDGDGERHTTFGSGEPMTMRIHCQVNTHVDDLICGVIVHRGDGYRLAHANTFFSGHELRCPPSGERFSLDLVMDELPLLGGHYVCTVVLAAHPMAHDYDGLEQAFDFRVTSPAPQIGLVSLGHRWSMSRDLLRPLTTAVADRYGLSPSTAAVADEGR